MNKKKEFFNNCVIFANLIFIFFASLIFQNCNHVSDFKLLDKYENESYQVFFVFTNAVDSHEILNWSEKFQKANKSGEIYIYFCADSLKTPVYYKGKVDHYENSFACYSNRMELFFKDGGKGHLEFFHTEH